jgi:hypothetical protein
MVEGEFMVHMGMSEIHEKWVVILEMVEKPKGEMLRQLAIKMKTGASIAEIEEVLGDAEILEMYEVLEGYGMLVPRVK